MEALKTYSRATLHQILRVVCRQRKSKHEALEAAVKEVLPYFELRDDGLWLARRDPQLHEQTERPFFEWHAGEDIDLPALPVPFTARDLAALFLDGGGYFVHGAFDNGDSLDETALRSLGPNSGKAREALCEAHRLFHESGGLFGYDDASAHERAKWLLGHSKAGPVIAAPESAPSEELPTEPIAAPDCTKEVEATCLPTATIAELLDGVVGKTAAGWKRKLGDLNHAAWLRPGVMAVGRKGKATTWKPVVLASLLIERRGYADYPTMNRLFLDKPELRPWLVEWQEYRGDRYWRVPR